ncbi:NADP-dependent oxidoreductase [Shewanella surugensis]|uniref:NADP-dependent oxidoreductase n=1 Tax=Shewanella surugensis TaxID=212020 RepID=A0ABT0LKY8_9GAMM|nr:NADP-dependent oxidoreductase [Shewanella surugensis]MCL1127962.1 NADP-dependent oxidoreductase [Shewanella surugensis]
MKAIIINKYGATSELVMANINRPQPGRGQVLIKTKAISINPIDYKTRQGSGIAFLLKDKFPKILGWDVAGIVDVVGLGVTNFSKGDCVFGMLRFPDESACYAEYVVADVNEIAAVPSDISMIEAAATTLAALTALQALTQMKVQPGRTILIQAAAGGVGHFAVQLAKLYRLRIIATGSKNNRDYVMSLGADHYIDYQDTNAFSNIVDGSIDYVIDGIAGKVGADTIKLVSHDGIICILPVEHAEPVLEKAEMLGIKVILFRVTPSSSDMLTLATYLARKQLIPKTEHTFDFSDTAIQHAHKIIEKGHISGKIVITI